MNDEIKKLLEKCDFEYTHGNYEKLIGLCDEILKISPDLYNALGYKGIAYCFLKQYDKACDILERAVELHPEIYYLHNNLSMVYYDLGEYEKSLECCENGLKIKQFDWLVENKIKALIMLDRIDEAIEYYNNMSCDIFFSIEDLLIDAGKYSAVIDNFHEDIDLIDMVKEKILKDEPEAMSQLGNYYMSWIDSIKFRYDVNVCPDCGGSLIPILYGYPSNESLKLADKGELYLGGCNIIIDYDYHCKNCGHEFQLGYKGFEIEWDDDTLEMYVEHKIDEITDCLKGSAIIFIRSLEGLKKDLKSFDDKEFDAFINHLIDIGYICEPKRGYVKIVGFDKFKTAKEYLDEDKFAAPKWLAFPQYSQWTIGWRMGVGETYAMNEPLISQEFKEQFPIPKYWKFSFSKSPYKPHPLIGYFWEDEGKPKYPKSSEGVVVNDFITLEDVGVFYSDTFTFNSIEHAVLLSKFLHFEKCGIKCAFDDLKNLKLTSDEEKRWKIYEYSVLLNASYFKVMQDENLKKKLLESGDEPLIYISDDDENLFGRALMELRDEIRRLCKNEDKIDWGYTEYLKFKPWR